MTWRSVFGWAAKGWRFGHSSRFNDKIPLLCYIWRLMDRVSQKVWMRLRKGVVGGKDHWNVKSCCGSSQREMRGRNVVFYYRSYVVEIKSRRISCLSISFKRFHASRHPK